MLLKIVTIFTIIHLTILIQTIRQPIFFQFQDKNYTFHFSNSNHYYLQHKTLLKTLLKNTRWFSTFFRNFWKKEKLLFYFSSPFDFRIINPPIKNLCYYYRLSSQTKKTCFISDECSTKNTMKNQKPSLCVRLTFIHVYQKTRSNQIKINVFWKQLLYKVYCYIYQASKGTSKQQSLML